MSRKKVSLYYITQWDYKNLVLHSRNKDLLWEMGVAWQNICKVICFQHREDQVQVPHTPGRVLCSTGHCWEVDDNLITSLRFGWVAPFWISVGCHC